MVEEEVAGEEGVWCGEMVWIRERMRREGERELYIQQSTAAQVRVVVEVVMEGGRG